MSSKLLSGAMSRWPTCSEMDGGRCSRILGILGVLFALAGLRGVPRTVTQNCESRFKSVLIHRKDEIGNLRPPSCPLAKRGSVMTLQPITGPQPRLRLPASTPPDNLTDKLHTRAMRALVFLFNNRHHDLSEFADLTWPRYHGSEDTGDCVAAWAG